MVQWGRYLEGKIEMLYFNFKSVRAAYWKSYQKMSGQRLKSMKKNEDDKRTIADCLII